MPPGCPTIASGTASRLSAAAKPCSSTRRRRRNRNARCRRAASAPKAAAAFDESGRAGGPGARLDAPSPDGKRTVFIRDWNLWVRDVATGKETQLTKDGVKDFGYATDNAGWTRSDRPIVLWSPDSKKIATFQQDQRNVGEMYLVDTRVGHPTLQAWKYPLPGDNVDHDDPARGHRRRLRPPDAVQDGPRPAPLHAVRRHGVPRRRMGRRAVERRRIDGRVRVDVARSQARAAARRRCGHRRRSAT